MKKHGSNTENVSQAVLRLGTMLWQLRAPLTFPACNQQVRTPDPAPRVKHPNHLATETSSEKLDPNRDTITTPPPCQPIKEITDSGIHGREK